jgi:exoribonuclease R
VDDRLYELAKQLSSSSAMSATKMVIPPSRRTAHPFSGKISKKSSSSSTVFFPPHLEVPLLEAGVKAGLLIRGILKISRHRPGQAVLEINAGSGGAEKSALKARFPKGLLIDGELARNRAMDGDEVAVELLSSSSSSSGDAKRSKKMLMKQHLRNVKPQADSSNMSSISVLELADEFDDIDIPLSAEEMRQRSVDEEEDEEDQNAEVDNNDTESQSSTRSASTSDSILVSSSSSSSLLSTSTSSSSSSSALRTSSSSSSTSAQPLARVRGIFTRAWRPLVAMVQPHQPSQLDASSSSSSSFVASSAAASIKMGDRVLVVPMSTSIPKIRIRTKQGEDLLGQRILVSIDSWPEDSKYPLGMHRCTLCSYFILFLMVSSVFSIKF